MRLHGNNNYYFYFVTVERYTSKNRCQYFKGQRRDVRNVFFSGDIIDDSNWADGKIYRRGTFS